MRTCIALIAFLFLAVLAAPAFGQSESGTTTPPSTEYKLVAHVVKPGETLSHLERKFKVTRKQVLSADINPVLAARNNPDLIYAGEVIRIPQPVTEVAPAHIPVAPKISAEAPSSVKQSPTKPVQSSAKQHPAKQSPSIPFMGAPIKASDTGVTKKITEAEAEAQALEYRYSTKTPLREFVDTYRQLLYFVALGTLAFIFLVMGVRAWLMSRPVSVAPSLVETSPDRKKKKEKPFSELTSPELLEVLNEVKVKHLAPVLQIRALRKIAQNPNRSWPEDLLVKDLGASLRSSAAQVKGMSHGNVFAKAA